MTFKIPGKLTNRADTSIYRIRVRKMFRIGIRKMHGMNGTIFKDWFY